MNNISLWSEVEKTSIKEVMNEVKDIFKDATIKGESCVYLTNRGSRGVGKTHTIISLAVKYNFPIFIVGSFAEWIMREKVKNYIKKHGSVSDAIKSADNIEFIYNYNDTIGRKGVILVDEPGDYIPQDAFVKRKDTHFIGFVQARSLGYRNLPF